MFKLELFKPPSGISGFGLETRITGLITLKICTKNDSYVLHISSKFQVSTFSRFKVKAFSISDCRICSFARKKPQDLQREGSRNPNDKTRRPF